MIDKEQIHIIESKEFNTSEVLEMYKLHSWSSAEKPDLLIKALKNSHSLVLAYYNDKLVGLGNTISDGYLVVYYPHLIVHPDFQGLGIGRMILDFFQKKYGNFHQQILVADGKAIDFYKKCGFERAGKTEPMWIFQGDEH